ncbi:MAG: adenosylcobinamide-GDP ribazoletransferase [Bauldia sp.]|uniref:adenosylcobinamide-GDP ribazoletransferase n=1 Tax=Bauldia sp. TaxID=2575872 RepID=UPI001E081408|nr:adenosylcobinamide-GDP ribazoletransferase [Bauldia sp.]MCB1494206.1 adenosylcobinamide-GDP ribazoletransferase [Bauldia sp.]
MPAADRLGGYAASLGEDLATSIGFLTRLPVARLLPVSGARPEFGRASRMFPVAGALVGLVGGAVIVIAVGLGVPLLVAAALAVAATMLVTGGLHEDGLADTFDGFGGGNDIAGKLEIMRDSRIGSHGAAALVFSILTRTAALGAIAASSAWAAGFALVAAEAVSRTAMMRMWHDLPAARADGLAHDTGPPDSGAMLTAQAIALALTFVLVWPGAGLAAVIAGILLSLAGTYILAFWTRRQIGGRTGDTLGACQQIALVSFLTGVAAAT